jgi:NAD(P)-dependent dehydrogenase (short-subunit alcohol dehydrogenase family)
LAAAASSRVLDMEQRISFDGQVAIVTGAGRGLGRTYALELAQRGAAVVVNDPGVETDGSGGTAAFAQAVVDEIRAGGGTAIASTERVGTPEAGEAIVAAAVDAFGRLDALVLNAGTVLFSPFEEITSDHLSEMLTTHIAGAFWTAQAGFRRLREGGGGRIVFVSSNAGVFGSTDQAAYCAAKGGVFGLSNAVALEGREHGILANAVMPLAATRMAGVRSRPVPELSDVLANLRSRLEPEFVMPLVVYLASSANGQTGCVFSAGAGRYARAIVGVPRGWACPGPDAPSVEEIAAHWGDIDTWSDLDEPESTVDELLLIARQLSTTDQV